MAGPRREGQSLARVFVFRATSGGRLDPAGLPQSAQLSPELKGQGNGSLRFTLFGSRILLHDLTLFPLFNLLSRVVYKLCESPGQFVNTL